MILDNPPLPFFRPSIRSYLFFLRGSSFKAFVKNIKSTLSNDTVAYHFKRLIVETYAEMVPSKNDWALIKWMHIEQPEIFKRFLLSVKSNNWFKLITDTWYNYVITRPNNEEWLNILIAKLAAWMNSFPMETILLWKDALHNEWGRKNAHTICLHFTQFQHYYIDGIGDVIHTLHECTSENPHYFGTIYCKYIEATGKGYEDLWKWMIRDINLSDKDAKNKLYCEDYHLIKGDFLQKHFLKSGVFLNIVLRTLSEWVEQSYYFEWEKFTTRLLEHVRIRENTTIFGTLNIDNLQTLMNAIKEAVLIHSRISSTWWINENKNLVSSKELAFRYILIKAYENNIETNISGIINQLADSELWDTGKLNYELGTLLNKSFHLLPINSQDQIADTIKDLYTNNKESDKNLQLAFEKARFEILIRIPACYRNYDVSNFIEKYITENGYFQPNKKTWPTSGMIKPPISKENLDKLSDKSKKQFFKYFNENKIRSSHPADTLLGGMTEILRLVNELAKNNPIKYILLAENPLFYEFTDSIVKNILEGVGSHIKCRLGVLHDPNFKPILPLPDIKDVARRLLDLIEKNRLMFSNDIDYARMLESCIDALSSKAEIDHIVQLLKPLCTNQESNENRISIQRAGSKNLRYEEIVTNVYNCVRGVAGKSAIKALNKQLELGLEPSKPILKIINKLASDESEVVRASLLMDLGYTSIRNKELGWKIFRVIFNKKQSTLWLLANNFVYHQYYSNFELVRPYLERMKKEALNEAGEIWSKLSALCMINGDYDQENFLNELREINRPEVWEGALSVFIANLEKTSDGVCQTSYCKCLKEEDVRIVFGNLFDSAFRLKKKESI